MNKKYLAYIISFTGVLSGNVLANGLQRDPRYISINKDQLLRIVRHTTSSQIDANLTLLDRAYYAKLSNVAYHEYKRQAALHPYEPYNNLYCGLAAEQAFTSAMMNREDPGSEYLSSANQYMLQAYQQDPRSATILSQYGFFLWQFYNQENKGLSLVVKASKLEPHNARIHTLLYQIYENRSGNAFDFRKAIQEASFAFHDDPRYAEPHWYLANDYYELKQYNKAKEQLYQFLSLAPQAETRKSVKQMRDLIAAKLISR